jgi:PAS domain S-box-containing protein
VSALHVAATPAKSIAQAVSFRLSHVVLFAAGYVALAYFSQWLALNPGRQAILSLAGGLYLAVLLSSDARSWWRWAATAFVLELSIEVGVYREGWAEALFDAMGHVLGALAAAHVVRIRCGLPFQLTALRETSVLTFAATVLSPAISIALNVLFLLLMGRGFPGLDWFGYWASDVAGVLVVTPLILALKQQGSEWRMVPAMKWLEGALLAVTLVAVLHIIFSHRQPMVYLALPFILWAALRFGPVGTALVMATFAIVIVRYSASGVGPYGEQSLHGALLAQTFLVVTCIGALCLAAIIQQYKAAQQALRHARDELEQRVLQRTAALSASEQQLRESNALFKIARAAAKMIIVDWHVGTDTFSYSDDPSWLRGPLPASGKYPRFRDQVHEQDRTRFLEMRQRALDTLRGGTLDFRVVRTDHVVLWVQSYQTVFAGANGKATRLVSAMQDISARRRTEASLRESEHRLRALLDGIPERAWLKDAERRYVAVNRAFEEGIGLPAATIIGKTVFDIRPRDVAERNTAEESLVIAHGAMMRVERLSSTRGTWIEITKTPIFGADGAYVGMVGIWRDISVRKQAEQMALQDSEQRYRTLVDATAQSVWVLDAAGNLTSVIKSLTGRAVADVQGRNWLEFVHAADRVSAAAALQAALDSKCMYEHQHRVLNKNGGWWDVLARAAPVLHADGSVREWVGTSMDISAQKKAERALIESNLMLRRLSGRREEMLETERARIAHNLHDGAGQSLNVVRLKIAALVTEPAGGASTAFTTALREILGVIDQVNQEVRSLEVALSPPVLRQLGLVPALGWLSEEMQRTYGLDVKVSDDGEEQVLDQANRAATFRAVRELLINVAKHAKVNAAHVDVQSVDGKVVITVSDMGIGFDVARLDHMDFSSSGLGLAMVRERIEFSGGSVRFDSRPGAGTASTIIMPLNMDVET